MNEATLDSFDLNATVATCNRYQRIAPLYDVMEGMMERRYRPWRERVWSMARGPKVLEVGVGTGKNMPFYRPELEITAIDLTPGMLDRARERAIALKASVQLCLGDVQSLDFPDGTFDAAVATFVFCSVPNPVLGLAELRRVVKPGGQVLLLEHTRTANPFAGRLFDLFNPLVVRMVGANINRQTLSNVRQAGFQLEEAVSLGGVYKLIAAQVG